MSEHTSADGWDDGIIRRLTEIRARVGPDLTLQQFLRLVDNWRLTLPLPIGLILDGLLVRGFLASRLQFSRKLDDSVVEHLDRAAASPNLEDDEREFLSVLRDSFGDGPFSRLTQLRHERDEETSHAVDSFVASHPPRHRGWMPDVLDVPRELAESYVQYTTPRTGFALRNAEVHVAGEGWVNVGLMRVHTSQVASWWVLPASTEVDDTFENHPD